MDQNAAELVEGNQAGVVSEADPNVLADCIEKILLNPDWTRFMDANA
jgi:hypothetical protein